MVAGTLAASAFAAVFVPKPAPTRAATDLSDHPFDLGSFEFKESSGKTVTEAELADRVWIASFIFTRCPLSCPKISSKMRELQAKLSGTGVQLVSISVDPDFDTTSVLSSYADRFQAEKNRWWFLTGSKKSTYDLIQDRFKLSVQNVPESKVTEGVEPITHASRLALVD